MSIEEQWEGFKDKAISKDACAEQINDERNCFYAGAITTLIQIKDISGKEDEEGFKILNALMNEAESFMQAEMAMKKMMGGNG